MAKSKKKSASAADEIPIIKTRLDVERYKWDERFHRMGKQCGYTDFGEQGFAPAPGHTDAIDRLLNEERAIHKAMNDLNVRWQARLVEIEIQKERWWAQLADDYGLDLKESGYSYNMGTSLVTRRPRSSDEERLPDKVGTDGS